MRKTGEEENKMNQKKEKKYTIQHWMKIALLLAVYDVIATNLCYGLAIWLRFDLQFSSIPEHYLNTWIKFIPIYAIAVFIIHYAMNLYHSMWRFASFNELERICIASALTLIVQIAGTCIIFEQMPVSYYVFGAILQLIATAGIRFSYRALRLLRARIYGSRADGIRNVMIIGAGEAGKMLLREILVEKPRTSRACCFIDDNSNKTDRMIDSIPIAGTRRDIPEMVEKYSIDRIIIALPSACEEDRRAILEICKETGCELKILPGISRIINGKATLNQLQDVSVEDLLGREPIHIDMQEVGGYLTDKTVLVTGGGGSIGSELVRQVASYRPRKLIIFDIYENNVYDIQQELRWHFPELDLEALIGSVRDRRRIRQVMAEYKPDIVYHAAAHKHVPLMEKSPNEAIKNNVLGTYETTMAAGDAGVSRFVLISTDKAVNPTNIMGASKRLCEMIVQAMNDKYDNTVFAAVRFGNVLGSNGSVVPLFKKQIAAGGPVTVTHPEITRFFMTIPEAVSLVLQAGAYADKGEVFVLDMGQPVKIADLARNMILLSGHTPDGDIRIEYTGLRPGEKLYEELLMAEEGLTRTDNELIYIGRQAEIEEDFLIKVQQLEELCRSNSRNIKEHISSLVPTYHVQNERAASLEPPDGPLDIMAKRERSIAVSDGTASAGMMMGAVAE